MRKLSLLKQFLSCPALCCFALLHVAHVDAQIQNGVYTAEQASRGQAIYSTACITCHGQDLGGNSNSPGLKGMSFMFLWEGRSVGEFFEKIRSEMPTDRPGQLPPQDYVDVVAYILGQNDFPSGDTELTPDLDALSAIVISAP